MEGTAFFGAGERGGPRVYDGHDHLVELGAAKHQTVTSYPSSRFFWGRASQEEEGMEKNIRTLSRRQRAPQQSFFFFLPGGAVPLLYLLLLLFIFFPFLSQCPFFPLYTKWRHIRSSPPHDRRALPGAHNNNDDDDNSFSIFPADFPLLLLQTILIRFHSNNLTTSVCWVR